MRLIFDTSEKARCRRKSERYCCAILCEVAVRPVSASNELKRLERLTEFGIGPGAAQADLDQILKFATSIFQVPTAMVSLVESHRIITAAKRGIAIGAVDRDTTFCTYVEGLSQTLIVRDASLDHRFMDKTIELPAQRSEFRIELSLSMWCTRDHAKFGAITRDISERKATEDSLYRLAHLDSLTQLPNRMVPRQRLEEMVVLGRTASWILTASRMSTTTSAILQAMLFSKKLPRDW